jgi:hypothetical protein
MLAMGALMNLVAYARFPSFATQIAGAHPEPDKPELA